MTKGAGVLIFFGILFFLAGIVALFSGSLVGFAICFIFGITFVYIGVQHYLKVQLNNLKEGRNKFDEDYAKYSNAHKKNRDIKVVKEGNKIIAKGIPKISKGAILTGILILVLCLLSAGSPKPFNVLAIAIFGMIIIAASLVYAIKERKKAIREYIKKRHNKQIVS